MTLDDTRLDSMPPLGENHRELPSHVPSPGGGHASTPQECLALGSSPGNPLTQPFQRQRLSAQVFDTRLRPQQPCALTGRAHLAKGPPHSPPRERRARTVGVHKCIRLRNSGTPERRNAGTRTNVRSQSSGLPPRPPTPVHAMDTDVLASSPFSLTLRCCTTRHASEKNKKQKKAISSHCPVYFTSINIGAKPGKIGWGVQGRVGTHRRDCRHKRESAHRCPMPRKLQSWRAGNVKVTYASIRDPAPRSACSKSLAP